MAKQYVNEGEPSDGLDTSDQHKQQAGMRIEVQNLNGEATEAHSKRV